MHSLIDLLRNIGLSEKEALTYLINLKVGTNPASVIAKHSELNRCTTYSILETLIQKGLITQFERDNIRFFTPLPPEKLVTYIDEKSRDLAFFKDEISSFLPDFQVVQHKDQIKPSLKSYSGKKGLLQIFHSIAEENSLSIVCLPAKSHHEFFHRFAPIYLNSKKSLRIIQYTKSKLKKYEINSLNKLTNLKPLIPVQFICKNKIFLTSPYESYGIEIINPELVKFFLNQFEMLWHRN